MSFIASCVAIIVFCIGVWGMIMKRNLIMKLLGLNIVNTSSILFIISTIYEKGDQAPIITPDISNYADPLPQALVYTAIVINFGILALSLIFIMVIVARYHTLDVDKIEREARRDLKEGNG